MDDRNDLFNPFINIDQKLACLGNNPLILVDIFLKKSPGGTG